MWRRAVFQMDDRCVKEACAGIAWHPYDGHPEMISWFRKQHPECENHWTEGGIVPLDLANIFKKFGIGDIAAGFISAIKNGIQSITVWNLALDASGYPNIGPFACTGTVEIARDGSAYKYAEEFYALVHFSKYIKRGARRLEINHDFVPRNFEAAAFVNPDGGRVVLIANTDKFDSTLILKEKGEIIPLRILRESVNTVLL
jgi:glucosylceramidase